MIWVLLQLLVIERLAPFTRPHTIRCMFAKLGNKHANVIFSFVPPLYTLYNVPPNRADVTQV